MTQAMTSATEKASPRATGRCGAGTRRAKGKKTRRKILEATLEVIAGEGIRGVTHRAVAAEAGVQLSLTTYYFKDIEELIKEAFQLFCERMRPDLASMWADIFAYLDRIPAAELRRKATREQVCERLTRMAGDYLVTQILHKPTGLAVEQIFFSEARLSPDLRRMGAEHRAQLLQPLVQLCRYFNRRDPEIDAELLLDTITALEYQGAGRPREELDRQRVNDLLRRQLGWIMGLKRA